MVSLERFRALAHKIGPYLLLEAVLPGGSLLALSLFLYRRYSASLTSTPVADDLPNDASDIER